jgi:hypothetical protein
MQKISNWLRLATFLAPFLATLAALVAISMVAPALARPPTSSINPGYDRRLQESRAALAQPVTPAPVHRTHKTGYKTVTGQ